MRDKRANYGVCKANFVLAQKRPRMCLICLQKVVKVC